MSSDVEICRVSECHKPVKARGLCDMHYARLRRTGSLHRKTKNYSNSNITRCLAFHCEERAKKSGLCERHYTRLKRKGSPYKPKVIRLCGIRGCDRPHQAKGMCQNHYNMWAKILADHGLKNHKVGREMYEECN